MTKANRTSDNPLSPHPDTLLQRLKEVYSSADKAHDFLREEPVWRSLIPLLVKDLQPGYVIQKPLGLGSTAIVWVVSDPNLKQKRAMKVPRPRLAKLKDIVQIVRAEAERLAALNHQNVIKIYAAGKVEATIDHKDYLFPYFIMEYLDQVQDLDAFVLSNYSQLTSGDIIACFRDALNGILFLHSNGVIHCDVKPGNILLGPNKVPLVADLGYAKPIPRIAASGVTEVAYTPEYAHPQLKEEVIKTSDSAANVATISRDKLKPAFDLFAFGRTMQEILIKIRALESEDGQYGIIDSSKFTRYQWTYLSFISKRLLDGIVDRVTEDELASQIIPGLPKSAMREIRYGAAEEAVEDFEKLLNLYDLEGEIPELNPNIASYIQIPHTRVPLTDRVRHVLGHPTFARLARVTQLGFVSYVYPGAAHTRFEHVIGTFSQCCSYIRALWYDRANCLFQNIMSKKDLEVALLAALLHDCGQYPMAHDLTEICSDFDHERFTEQVLEYVPPDYEESLSLVIRAEWGTNIDDVLRVLNANEHSNIKHRILKSLISSPLDCDKLDYLLRDSTHCGVNFGRAIDEDRLYRNLTTVYASRTVDGREILEYAEIGVTEKALSVANVIWRAREQMFRQVYWQHSVRALKAMLAYVVRSILNRFTSEEEKDDFWAEFGKYLLSGQHSSSKRRDAIEKRFGRSSRGNLSPEFLRERPGEEAASSSFSFLSPSDDSLVLFLYDFAGEEARTVLSAIRSRRLYKRLAVLSGRRMGQEYEHIYDTFRAYRLKNDLAQIERDREVYEKRLVEELKRRLWQGRSKNRLMEDVVELIEELDRVKPLILLDVPMKAISPKPQGEAFHFLPEGLHSEDLGPFLRFEETGTSLEQAKFDKDVGKIRVLCHPEWSSFFTTQVPDSDVKKHLIF